MYTKWDEYGAPCEYGSAPYMGPFAYPKSVPVCLLYVVAYVWDDWQQKSRQHPDFPGGHPPEYYPSLRLLNFAERTGYGVLSLRWPSTNGCVAQPYCFPPPTCPG